MNYDVLISEVLKKQKKLKKTIRRRIDVECDIWEKDEELNVKDEKEEDKIFSDNESLYIPKHLISEIRSHPVKTVLKCKDFNKDNISITLALELFSSEVQEFKKDKEENYTRKEFKVWFCLNNGEDGFVDGLIIVTNSKKCADNHYKKLSNLIDTLSITDLIKNVIDEIEYLIKKENNHIKQLNDKLRKI